MALKEQLFEDLKSAMKEKDTIRKDTVQLIRSGILQIEKDKKIQLDDQGVIEVIAKQLKSRRDSMPDYVKSGRQDLVEKLNREIEILLNYLPEQLSESEIQKVIDLLETGETNTDVIQEKLDEVVCAINDLQEEFDENDSEIETVARDSIGVTVDYILKWFGISIDIEEAIRERDW